MEEIDFDDLELVSLKKEVFIKLPLLCKYVYSKENYDILIEYLKYIHKQSTERVLDAISFVNDELVRRFGQRITQETERLYNSSLLWEWIYLLAYYLHQIDDDQQWKENFLPHMKDFQIRPAAINEMNKGEELIDQYINKRWRVIETQERINNSTITMGLAEAEFIEPQDDPSITDLEQLLAQKEEEIAKLQTKISELQQQLAEVQETSTTTGPTTKQLEATFTYPYRQKDGYNLLIDFLTKEAKNTTDIQWARHALAIFENTPSVLIDKPADFKSWLVDFCDLFGRKWVRDYEPKKLRKVKGKRAKPSGATKYLPCN